MQLGGGCIFTLQVPQFSIRMIWPIYVITHLFLPANIFFFLGRSQKMSKSTSCLIGTSVVWPKKRKIHWFHAIKHFFPSRFKKCDFLYFTPPLRNVKYPHNSTHWQHSAGHAAGFWMISKLPSYTHCLLHSACMDVLKERGAQTYPSLLQTCIPALIATLRASLIHTKTIQRTCSGFSCREFWCRELIEFQTIILWARFHLL